MWSRYQKMNVQKWKRKWQEMEETKYGTFLSHRYMQNEGDVLHVFTIINVRNFDLKEIRRVF